MEQSLTAKDGCVAGFPIVIGYLPSAMAFGLLAKTTGLSLFEALGFSVFVFAGASQFMALTLIQAQVAWMEIGIATFLLNLRHLLMSAALAGRIKTRGFQIPWIAFGVTDETFAVAATRKDKVLSSSFMLTLEGVSYGSWVGGTALGFLVGAILPRTLQNSMGIALYAMFVAILIPEVKKSWTVGALAVSAGLFHLGLGEMKLLPQGWNMVAAIVLASAIGAWFIRDDLPGGGN